MGAVNKATSSSEPPRDLESLKAMLIEMRDELPPRLLQVAAFALANPDEMAFGTAAGIAAQVAVQPSTIIRFAKRIGYSGFSDLQRVFRSVVRSSWPDYRERLARVQMAQAGGGPLHLLSGFAESAIASLERLMTHVSQLDIDRAAEILARAEVVYLLGMRRAFPIAFYLAYALGKLGVRFVLADHVAGLGPEQLAEASGRDALVAVSFTPYTPMTVELTERLASRHVRVIALTDGPFSPLSPKATLRIDIPEVDYAGFRSLSAALCVAMALGVATAARRQSGARV